MLEVANKPKSQNQVPMKLKLTWRFFAGGTNPPALGSCEMSGFSKSQKDILALIDAAIQLKFLMHLGKQRRSKRERRSCQCFGRQPFRFRRNATVKVWYWTPLTYRSQVQWSAHEPLNSMSSILLQCQPIWEALQKRSTPQLPSSTKYIKHIHNAPFDSCFTRSFIFLRPKPQQQQLPAPVVSEPKASDK